MDKSYSDPRFFVECDDVSSAISMVGLNEDEKIIMIEYVSTKVTDEPDKKYYYTCNDYTKAKLAILEHYYLYDEENPKSSGRFINNLKKDLNFVQIDYEWSINIINSIQLLWNPGFTKPNKI